MAVDYARNVEREVYHDAGQRAVEQLRAAVLASGKRPSRRAKGKAARK